MGKTKNIEFTIRTTQNDGKYIEPEELISNE